MVQHSTRVNKTHINPTHSHHIVTLLTMRIHQTHMAPFSINITRFLGWERADQSQLVPQKWKFRQFS